MEGGELFDLPDAPRPDPGVPAPVRFLGEYDNVLLGHADRRRIIPPDYPWDAMLAPGRWIDNLLVDGMLRASWWLERDGRRRATLAIRPATALLGGGAGGGRRRGPADGGLRGARRGGARRAVRAGGRVMVTDRRLLAEQIAYYRAVAGGVRAPCAAGSRAATSWPAALDAFAPAGQVLELACGPGSWTPQLLRHAAHVTAVDASPEMLALAAARVGDGERVTFVEADLFAWRPARRYDVVFFGFWLSHVPDERFDAFWTLVADALAPGGRVFFADDGHREPDELIEGEESSTIRRRLDDGTAFRIVKTPLTAAALEARLRGLGWDIAVTQTSGPFFWGAGGRSSS